MSTDCQCQKIDPARSRKVLSELNRAMTMLSLTNRKRLADDPDEDELHVIIHGLISRLGAVLGMLKIEGKAVTESEYDEWLRSFTPKTG